MMRCFVVLFILMTMVLSVLPTLAMAAPGTHDERVELKERFRQRYATLIALKKAEKVGETFKGLAAAVKKEYLATPADPQKPDGQTVQAFLEEENRDRVRLYEMIAKDTGATPEAVAKRDAERRFKQAKPEEFLQVREDRWVRKRDL